MSLSVSPPPLSSVRRAGNFLYLSGQLPRNQAGEIVGGGIEDQTRQVLANMNALLQANGAKLSDIVKVTAWITDARHFAGFNSVYREFFQEPFPTRSTVVAQLVMPGADVEIEAVAYLV